VITHIFWHRSLKIQRQSLMTPADVVGRREHCIDVLNMILDKENDDP